MAKEKLDKNISLIKKLTKENKLIFGIKQTIKLLKLGKIDRVFLASNSSDEIREDMEYYCGIAKVPLVKLAFPNTELGLICKKHFSVLVIGVLKEKS